MFVCVLILFRPECEIVNFKIPNNIHLKPYFVPPPQIRLLLRANEHPHPFHPPSPQTPRSDQRAAPAILNVHALLHLSGTVLCHLRHLPEQRVRRVGNRSGRGAVHLAGRILFVLESGTAGAAEPGLRSDSAAGGGTVDVEMKRIRV